MLSIRTLACTWAAAGLLPSVLAAVAGRRPIGNPLKGYSDDDAVPPYVLQYAPLVYLFTGEQTFPSSIAAQLTNTAPKVNFAAVANAPAPLTLDNLDQLNALGDTNVYLSSLIDPTADPAYFKGQVPNAQGLVPEVSSVVVTTDHGDGKLDAFYFYFYAFNYGGKVLHINLGNHVGDWEHNMVRFENGTPTEVWYSQHSNGEAFTYDALEKSGPRPIGYVANGTHAVYATQGTHDHTIPDLNLPRGLLEDHTDKGAVFDPVANAYFYRFNTSDSTFIPYPTADGSAPAPVGFMNFNGQWGDQQFKDDDDRQFKFFGQPRWSNGPNGPKFKDLNRDKVCPNNGILCIVRPFLGP